jgi:predicted nuclease of predicted toxin-antitoxin system
MKIKLDENIPARLVNILSQFGHEIDTVPQEGLIGCSDNRIWEAAQNSKSFLITQDLDFSNTERFKPGNHFGILLIRFRAPGREALVRRIKNLFQDEDVERWKGCFVVITENKIRIRHPEKPKG